MISQHTSLFLSETVVYIFQLEYKVGDTILKKKRATNSKNYSILVV